MARVKKQKSAKSGKEGYSKLFVEMVEVGESLGNELIDSLSGYGSTFDGLVIETYAITKAWAALRAIAESEGFDAVDLSRRLLPSFLKEMQAIVKEVDEE